MCVFFIAMALMFGTRVATRRRHLRLVVAPAYRRCARSWLMRRSRIRSFHCHGINSQKAPLKDFCRHRILVDGACSHVCNIYIPTHFVERQRPKLRCIWNPRDELTIGSLHIHSVDLIRIRRRHIGCVTRRVEVDPRTNVSKHPRMQLQAMDRNATIGSCSKWNSFPTCPIAL